MISKILANPICKHIAKATQANAPTEALLKSLQMPANVTAFQDGFRITHRLFIYKGVRESLRLFAYVQKNKINLCFADRLVQIDNDKNIKLNN